MSGGWVGIGCRRPEARPSLARKGGIENVELEAFSDSAAAMWELYDSAGRFAVDSVRIAIRTLR
jgi:hypothetical protein